jgi:hypothetical protein
MNTSCIFFWEYFEKLQKDDFNWLVMNSGWIVRVAWLKLWVFLESSLMMEIINTWVPIIWNTIHQYRWTSSIFVIKTRINIKLFIVWKKKVRSTHSLLICHSVALTRRQLIIFSCLLMNRTRDLHRKRMSIVYKWILYVNLLEKIVWINRIIEIYMHICFVVGY